MTLGVILQVALELWGALFALICMIIIFLGMRDGIEKSRGLLSMMFVDIVLLVSDSLAFIFRGNMTALGFYMVRISNYLVFMAMPAIAAFLVIYISNDIKINGYTIHSGWKLGIWTISFMDAVLITISQFTDLFYYFDENNLYHRTDNYIYCALLGMVMMIAITAMIICNREKLSRYETYALLSYVLLPFCSNIIQLFHYGISLNNIALTSSLMLIFIAHEVEKSKRIVYQNQLLHENELAISRQAKELAQKDAELAQKRIQVSMSQMRPHFMFNALATIEQLCHLDPEKAESAIHHFAKYLRSNLNAMSTTELIPFSKEMEHIRTYIWLELMRFEDRLSYYEEIETKDFHLPSLSIQPLVENAVKHGMMTRGDGLLEVCIRTYEEDDYYVIEVIDDGGGFNPEDKPKNNRHPNIGLPSARERIQMMTNGELDIKSKIGEGTKVTVRIPCNQNSM